MDWPALWLSLRLAFWTTVILVPAAIVIARLLAWRRFRGRGLVEALVTLPLVLPPTVLGYYILVALGRASPLGSAWEALTGQTLVFNFTGLLVASIIFNLPFAIQPIQRSLEGISPDIREAAWCSGLSVFAGVSELPTRVKCAILPWHTLHAALNSIGSTSTEAEADPMHAPIGGSA